MAGASAYRRHFTRLTGDRDPIARNHSAYPLAFANRIQAVLRATLRFDSTSYQQQYESSVDVDQCAESEQAGITPEGSGLTPTSNASVPVRVCCNPVVQAPTRSGEVT